MINVEEIYNKYNDGDINGDEYEIPDGYPQELYLLELIHRVFPDKKSIISCADHDVIYLNLDVDEVKSMEEKDVILMFTCGVCYEDDRFLVFV